MLSNICSSQLRLVGQCLRVQARRNIGSTAVVCQTADPIQQLFVKKLREYGEKSKAAGGRLVDASPELLKEMDTETERLQKVYNADGKDMTKFPSFTYKDPKLERSPVPQEAEDELPL